MNASRDERYLWDRSGPVDPEIAALEGLLAGFGQRAAGQRAAGQRRRRRRALWSGAVAVAAALLGLWALLRPESRWPPAYEPVAGRPGLSARPAGDVARPVLHFRLRAGAHELGVPRGARGLALELPGATAWAGASARLRAMRDSAAWSLEAVGGLVAVDTADGRLLLLPAGARLERAPGRPPGTPLLPDTTPAVTRASRALDECAPGAPQRGELAEELALAAVRLADTLPLWHLLEAPQPRVVAVAEKMLVRLAGLPAPARGEKRLQNVPPQVWRAHLESLWRGR